MQSLTEVHKAQNVSSASSKNSSQLLALGRSVSAGMQSSPPTELAAKALPQFPGSSNEDLHSTSRSFPREGTMAFSMPSSPLPPSLTKLIKPWWKGEQRIYRWQNIDFCSSRTTGRRWRTPQKLCEVWDTDAISAARTLHLLRQYLMEETMLFERDEQVPENLKMLRDEITVWNPSEHVCCSQTS